MAALEQENVTLRHTLQQRTQQMKGMQGRVAALELEANEATEKARHAVEEQSKLVRRPCQRWKNQPGVKAVGLYSGSHVVEAAIVRVTQPKEDAMDEPLRWRTQRRECLSLVGHVLRGVQRSLTACSDLPPDPYFLATTTHASAWEQSESRRTQLSRAKPHVCIVSTLHRLATL